MNVSGIGGFYSSKTSSSGGRKSPQFKADLSQAMNKRDTIEITGSPYTKKLKELREIAEKADYTGMTDVEIYKTIYDRYDSTIKDFRAQLLAASGPNGDLVNQFDEELHSALKGSPFTTNELHMKAYYDGMSKQEIKDTILKKLSGKGTTIDYINVLQEMGTTHVISSDFVYDVTQSMIRSAEKKACEMRGIHYIDDGWNSQKIRDWALGSMTTDKTSWDIIMKEFEESDRTTREKFEEYLPDFRELIGEK